MELAKAKSKYMRISPQKARLAAGLIRGKSVADAMTLLKFSGLKGGRMLLKTLNSAVANAEQENARREDLVIFEVKVDEGPRMKRAKSKNRGGRHPILKRMSHFTLVVAELEGVR